MKHNSVWVVLLGVLVAGCPFEGTTKFTGDTTEYTSDTFDSITVSTSGETLLNGRPVSDEWRMQVFVQESFENLQQDLARGSGEYLSSLADLARVPDGRQQEFFRHAMDRYGVTIRSGSMTPEQLRLAVLTDWKAD